MMPSTDANTFLAVCAALAAIMSVIFLGVQLWKSLFPEARGDEAPVSRREFDERLDAMQAKSDKFREDITERVADATREIARVAEALQKQNENFGALAEAMQRAAEENRRAEDARLRSIEEHLRR